jgi:hypothetical protein
VARATKGEEKGPDPYKVLGLTSLASREEIVAAYRSLAQRYHPDRHTDSPARVQREAEQRMREVNQAFVILKKAGWSSPSSATPRSHVEASWAPDPTTDAEARRRAYRAARQHVAQARAAQASRVQERESVPAGEARPAAKNYNEGKVVFGMAQALYTNELTCRTCRSTQRLPPGWQDRLGDTNWSCSMCGRVILSR